jgi:hypothetical protein
MRIYDGQNGILNFKIGRGPKPLNRNAEKYTEFKPLIRQTAKTAA